MTKYIIGVIALLVIIGGVWYWMQHSSSVAPDMGSTDQGTTMAATSTYATSTFSVVYPSDFTVDPNYQYTEVANKPIPGVSFIIPGSMATGTNLASDSYVSIESLPRAKICTGDIYLPENVKSKAVNDNGVDYSLATSSGVAAGNLYEEDVYAISGSKPCTAVRYYIHSSDINNYPPGSVTPFDESALLSAFDSIRHSLTLTPAQ